MKIFVETTLTVCDCCKKELPTPEIIEKEDPLSIPYTKKNRRDICHNCAILIFKSLELEKDILSEQIEHVREQYSIDIHPEA